ncbi:MAG: diadenylate cyclase [Acidimicrobiia bacterium]
MGAERTPSPARLRRLVDELAEDGFVLDGTDEWRSLLLAELDYALRPTIHERRVPSYGAIISPTTDPSGWDAASQLTITHQALGETPRAAARLFADGLSSWLVRQPGLPNELVVFDRPAGSERDLVVLAEALGGTIVQRHPAGVVRFVGDFGVLRWDGLGWHHEPPLSSWIDSLSVCAHHGDQDVLETLLEFAVHDLGSRGIGAILVYRTEDCEGPMPFELRLPTPPPLQISRPADLAPLRHVLAQVDGAAVFDRDGTLRQLGVRLIPSAEAESDVEGYRGMRHTSGRRYSFDDRTSTVIVVSEDGPVTVLRKGVLLGSSPAPTE